MNIPRRIIFPPVWMVLGLILIFALAEYLPLAQFSSTFATVLGSFAIVIGLLLLLHAAGMFKAAETDLIPFGNVTTLVTGGVYRVSRNPMYLGMTLILFGVALTVGAFPGLLVAPLFMALIELRFIRPEEALLRAQFGADFEHYCKLVRRWL